MVKTTFIQNMSIEYETIERNVKYPRIEFKTGRLQLIVPKQYDAENLIEKKQDWILKKALEIKRAKERAGKAKLEELKYEELKETVNNVVNSHSEKLEIEPNNIFFRTMKSKWASCSQKGNLTLNRLMRYLPKHLIEYVIFHEMLHLKDRKHSGEFWRQLKQIFPKAEKNEKELLEYWFLVQDAK